jgi:transketolase
MRPLTARFEGFGLSACEVDGHDVGAIMAAICRIREGGKPGVIVCNTVKGRDVTFAEWQPIWHYKSMTDEQYAEAMAHLDKLEELA